MAVPRQAVDALFLKFPKNNQQNISAVKSANKKRRKRPYPNTIWGGKQSHSTGPSLSSLRMNRLTAAASQPPCPLPSAGSIASTLHGPGLLLTAARLPGKAHHRQSAPSRELFPYGINGKHLKRRTADPEPDIAPGEGKSINPFGIILIRDSTSCSVAHLPAGSPCRISGSAFTSSRGSGFVPAKPPVACGMQSA